MERWRKPEVEYGSGGDHPSRSSLDYKSRKPEVENNGCSSDCAGSNVGELPRRSSLDYNTPLRSALRNFGASAPSPFYKLSSELSRESLRIPGAVPFMWEQSPGRRKFSTTTSALAQSCISPHNLEQEFLVPEIINVSAADPEKPASLASIFRESSPKGACLVSTASASPVSSAISQIAPPPSADHPRSSSARYSIMQRSIPTVTFFNNAVLHDGDEDAASDATSDALTATAGGVSVDDESFMLSGAMRLASTPSEARDFIMHRFLPAAHTIACDSPQTPSRRFLPPGMAAAPTAATSSLCNGSFRDHAAACGAAGRPSPLLYSSVSSTPGMSVAHLHSQSQLRTGSFHGEEEEEEEEEEPPFTPRACGIFPFRIHLSFHNRHRADQSPRRSPSSKHQDYKQQKKTNRKSVGCSGTPTRIMDILNDDHSSSPDDESPVHRLRSRKVEAERELMKVMAMERAVMYNSTDPQVKPLCASDYCYRGSPNVLQCSTTQQATSDPYNEEACEYNIYQDAPSRFNSPSPAALHFNTRLNTNPPPASVIISTTEQHLLNSSFYYTAINRPQCANPSKDSTNLNTNYHEIITNQDQWEANSSASNHITQKAHMITNALYEYEDQETRRIEGDHCISRGDNNVAKNGDYDVNNGGHHVNNGDHYVINGDLHKIRGDHCVIKGDHYVRNGNPYVINGGQQGDDYVSKGGKYVINGGHQGDDYAINGNYRMLKKDECPQYVRNGGDQYIAVSNGKSMDNYMSSAAWPRSLLLSPPLPKSPTHSWLDRAIPLAASTNKSLSSSSRLSHMHKASTSPPADHHDTHTYNKAAGSFADSRWEALVKGSHLQPGHLRFSKELCHQSSQSAIMKVGAS